MRPLAALLRRGAADNGRARASEPAQQPPPSRGDAEAAPEQALLAAVVESSDDAIVFRDLDGLIQTWNRGAELMYGYTAAEAIGRPTSILVPPGYEDEREWILERTREGRSVERLETVRVTKDGRLIDVSLTVSPVRDEQGRNIGASTIARDVTDRKRAEGALRDAEQRYRTLAEQLPLVTYIAPLEGYSPTLYVSPQIEQLTGYPPEQ